MLPQYGVISIHKPVGWSSADVIRKIKYPLSKSLNKKKLKVGHFGTLDPFASGLLVVAFGKATTLADLFHQSFPKTYRAKGLFGVKTDTGDLDGKVIIEKTLATEKSSEELETLVKKVFMPSYQQKVPAFSAAKVNGKKRYELARLGIDQELPHVEREILDFKIHHLTQESIDFEITVSSGTYIRQFFEDICEELKTVGHLSHLQRTKITSLSIENTVSPTCFNDDRWMNKIIENSAFKSVNEVFNFPKINLAGYEEKLFINGQVPHRLLDEIDPGCYWVYGSSGGLIGLLSESHGTWSQNLGWSVIDAN